MFRLRTFGGLWLERGAERVSTASPRQLGLLAAVAAAGDAGVSRDRLLLLLWPESTEAKARHALAQVLYRLRRDFGTDLLRTAAEDLLIESAHLSHDHGEFLVANAADAPERAAAIYTGPFLDGFYLPDADEFQRWAEVERARLRELAMQALEAAGHRAMTEGRRRDGADSWRRLCLLEPLNSRFAVGFMAALAESGDAAGAMRHGRAHDLACRQELGLPPAPAVGTLLTQLARGELHPAPRASGVAAAPSGTPSLSPDEAAPAARRRRPTRLLAVLGVVALVVAMGWWLPPLLRGDRGFSEGSLVVLADPVDLSGEPGLGRALAAATAVGLSQSRRIALLSRPRLAHALTRMGRSGDTTLTESLALEVAARENARAVFALTVVRAGASYVMTGRLISPADGGDLAAHRVTVPDLGDIVAGLDRLLGQVQASAGDPRSYRDSLPTLPLVTTHSLEALRLYAEAAESWRRLRYDQAGQLFRRAVEVDPEFALAHVALGSLALFGNNRPAADTHYATALRLRNRLTLREQLMLDSRLATARADYAEAIRLDFTLAERYPSRDTWYNYGTGLLQASRCPEAIPALQRALRFDSTAANAHLNMATCYRRLGENRLALDAYAAADRADSNALVSFNINHEWGGAFVRLGRYAEAEEAFGRMLTRSGGDQARGHRSLAFLAMLRGQYRDAIAHLTDAVALTQDQTLYLSRLRNEMLLAEAFMIRGAPESAARELDRALRLAGSSHVDPGVLALLGRVLVRAGQLPEARRVLARVDQEMQAANPIDQSARGLLFAELALARAAPEEALEAIQNDQDQVFAGWRMEVTGRALAGLGALDSALSVTATFSEREGLFGLEVQTDWVLAPLQVARLAESLGDSATATAALQRLLARWGEADADLPALRDARLSLARLQPTGRR